jgi:hypothetical protein
VAALTTWFCAQLRRAPYSTVGFEGDKKVEGQQDEIKFESTHDTVWAAMVLHRLTKLKTIPTPIEPVT